MCFYKLLYVNRILIDQLMYLYEKRVDVYCVVEISGMEIKRKDHLLDYFSPLLYLFLTNKMKRLQQPNPNVQNSFIYAYFHFGPQCSQRPATSTTERYPLQKRTNTIRYQVDSIFFDKHQNLAQHQNKLIKFVK